MQRRNNQRRAGSGWLAPKTRGGRVAVVIILALTVALIVVAWRLHWPPAIVTIATIAAAGFAASAIVPLVQGSDDGVQREDLLPARLADELARSSGRQWEREAEIRRLNEPYPLPVSWSAAPGLADDWEQLEALALTGAGWLAPDPANWACGPGELAGEGRGLAETLTRVPTRRLVVLGEPGSGKTMLLIRLVLDLLIARPPGGQVPVLFSLASWNPDDQDLYSWLTVQLAAGLSDSEVATALLDARLIIPLLDGLDEIPEPVRGRALAEINDGFKPGQMAVLTCRTEDYQRIAQAPGVTGTRLRAAAAIQLNPLAPSVVADYLVADAGGPLAQERWSQVLKVLRSGTAIGDALSTPLMAALVLQSPFHSECLTSTFQ